MVIYILAIAFAIVLSSIPVLASVNPTSTIHADLRRGAIAVHSSANENIKVSKVVRVQKLSFFVSKCDFEMTEILDLVKHIYA